MRFTRADIQRQNSLLVLVHVQPSGGDNVETVRRELSRAIRSRLSARLDVIPLVSVTVLDGG